MMPMKEYFNIFVQESLILTEDLEKIAQSENEIECLDHLCRCTLKIACGKTMQFILLLNKHVYSFVKTITKKDRNYKNFKESKDCIQYKKN